MLPNANPLLQATDPNQTLVDAMMGKQMQSKTGSLVPQTPIQPVGGGEAEKQSLLWKVPGLNGLIPGIGPLDLLGIK